MIKFTLACLTVLGLSAATVAVVIALKFPESITMGNVTHEETTDTRQLVVERLRTQSLLVTAQQEVSATITVDRDRALRVGLVTVPLPGQSLTYTVRGTASLGYDLSGLTRNEVTLDPNTVSIALGQPKIIAIDIDPSLSESSNGSVPPDMVTNALQLGREEIKLSLCQGDAFTTAEAQAAVVIADLLGLTGAQVTVTAQQPVCPALQD
jgi:hypothetical protein